LFHNALLDLKLVVICLHGFIKDCYLIIKFSVVQL